MSAKLERLMTLTATLLWAERPLRADELRERVPGYPESDVAFHRAFERDKDDLRELGIPLRTEPVPFTDPPVDGYSIRRREYELPDPGLDAEELAALHLAATVVRLDGVRGIDGLWKLGGRVGASSPGEVAVALPTTPHLVTVFQGFAERRPLRFRYRDADRTVDPYRLDCRFGRWYLTGWDHLREAERNFRVDRIEGEVELGPPDAFERPGRTDPAGLPAPWMLGEDEPVRAELLVDADQASAAVGHVGPDAVEEVRADGSVVLSLEVRNRAGFRSLVLSFLDHAEVLGPPELRAELVDWLDGLTGDRGESR